MNISQYIESVAKRYKAGNTTEHSFRGDLQNLIESLCNGISATNEPKRVKCGAPDYVLTKKDIPVGYIEAKDIDDEDLDGLKINKSQFDRYKGSLNNLIFTDYLDFRLYVDGKFKTAVRIAEIKNGKIIPIPKAFPELENLLKHFCTHVSQTITNSRKLAEMMAGKARMLSDVLGNALTSDEENEEDSTLKEQMEAFKQILINDITPKEFADVYAQTLAYGMFAARIHDSTLPTFSRQEAAELIPRTNPFLRRLFGYIAGPDIDERIKWIVDGLAEIFRASDVATILKDFGKATKMEDPIIHFYETFLTEYDPRLRKTRGVWYTPEPVVNFIVRSVDEILKDEFKLKDGLADTSKTKIKIKTPNKKNPNQIDVNEQEVHKVQILDPATGTGTFLSEVINQIQNRFKGQEGAWSKYVETHLIPRLNGFELLMASYAMAHLKMDMLLKESGYAAKSEQRFRIFLTNSLEESHPYTGSFFANWLSAEANEANQVKRDTPVMCIIGNPPYSGESANKGDWIMNLMEDYKKEPGGKVKLQERNTKWINADENKFIRFGQHFIEKNGSGVLAYINPHSYLDNPTLRGMRWHLLKTYDKIYVLDLHGNSLKKETTADGNIDQNVFDIMQGVTINIFIKTGKKKDDELGKLYHFDLFGKREFKYEFLANHSIRNIDFKEIENVAPNYFFVQKNFESQAKYERGFMISELFTLNNVGMVTARDHFTIHNSEKALKKTISSFLETTDDEEARTKFDLGKDVRDWQVNLARKDLKANYPKKGKITQVAYRLFDDRWTFYTGKSKGFHCYPRADVMQHFLSGDNVGLALCKQFKTGESYQHVFITNKIIESSYVSNKTSEITSVFPLYKYPSSEDGQQTLESLDDRVPNMNQDIIEKIELYLGLTFTDEKKNDKDTFSAIDLLDYIYAILHSPKYRTKYFEFLKINFPRIPYPKNPDTFWQFVELGSELRRVHLLETAEIKTSFPIDGTDIVSDIQFKEGRVYINEEQYFDKVDYKVWVFEIGGYQPAQKWLKDRKGNHLSFEDTQHYQKILFALSETIRLMSEINKIKLD